MTKALAIAWLGLVWLALLSVIGYVVYASWPQSVLLLAIIAAFLVTIWAFHKVGLQ